MIHDIVVPVKTESGGELRRRKLRDFSRFAVWRASHRHRVEFSTGSLGYAERRDSGRDN